MINITIEIWKKSWSDAREAQNRKYFSSLALWEKIIAVLSLLSGVVLMVFVIAGQFIFRDCDPFQIGDMSVDINTLALTISEAIALIFVLVIAISQWIRRKTLARELRLNRLAFYYHFHKNLSLWGLNSQSQLEMCLTNINGQLSKRYKSRNALATSLSIVFSLLISFCSLVVTAYSKATADKPTDTGFSETISLIVIFGIAILLLFLVVQMTIRVYVPGFSRYESNLSALSRDLSEYLIFNGKDPKQLTNLKRLVEHGEGRKHKKSSAYSAQ